jgi:hypothetical protein
MNWTHLRDTKPTARKEHQCFCCCEPIMIGDTYVQRSGVMDGNLDTFRMHLECEEATREWDLFDWESFSSGAMSRPIIGRGMGNL